MAPVARGVARPRRGRGVGRRRGAMRMSIERGLCGQRRRWQGGAGFLLRRRFGRRRRCRSRPHRLCQSQGGPAPMAEALGAAHPPATTTTGAHLAATPRPTPQKGNARVATAAASRTATAVAAVMAAAALLLLVVAATAREWARVRPEVTPRVASPRLRHQRAAQSGKRTLGATARRRARPRRATTGTQPRRCTERARPLRSPRRAGLRRARRATARARRVLGGGGG